ncbi:MAG: hypothetical protein JW908_09555 [Anaerolineales bacterium]|nr:hypothetical protein [Anaerolineales bacterium]
MILSLALCYWIIIPAHADDQNHIGLVVQFDDSNIVTKCISFSGDSINGYEVLQQSGLTVLADFSSMGAAMCKIGDVGCGEDNCWCQFPPTYWSYWHMAGNNWSYSQLGASLYNVQNGAVEGWRWGEGDPPTQIYSFDDICISATVTPTASDTPIPTTTTVQPTETTNVTTEVSNENSTPYTIYFDTSSSSSSSSATPSPSFTPASTSAVLSATFTPDTPIEIQGATLIVEIVDSVTPTITPTEKIKAAHAKATRQAKKTENCLKETMENFIPPTVLPSPTEIPPPAASENQGMFKFMAVLILLLFLASVGAWVLKKRT